LAGETACPTNLAKCWTCGVAQAVSPALRRYIRVFQRPLQSRAVFIRRSRLLARYPRSG